MGNQSDATDDIQSIADSLPDENEEKPISSPPSVIDIEGKVVRLDRGNLGSQRPVQGIFTPRSEFKKISSQDKDKDT